MKSVLPVLLCTLAMLVPAAHANDADYPARPITIVVPWTTGGSPDLLARVIGEKLSPRMGQPVVVQNRAGASGTIGAGQVARSPGDGYTLMSTPNTFVLSPLVLPKSAVTFDVQKDFVPVIVPAKTLMVLAVHPSLGVKTLPEFVRYARENKNLSYTGSGSGSPQHVAGEMLKKAAGIDMSFVPYKGVAPALTDTLAGHVKVIFVPYSTVAQHEKSGALIILGGLDAERTPMAPGVVPLREQGYPGMVVGVWTGFFAPRGTPAPVVARLNREINAILKMPDVMEKLQENGQILVGGSPEVLANMVKQDTDTFTPIVRSANITAE